MSAHTHGKLALEEVASDSGHIKHLCPVDSEGMSLLTVVEHEGVKFAAVYSDDDARRLVAAWNACDGLSIEQLERAGTLDRASVSRNVAISNTIKTLTAERDSLRAVNADLLAALTWAVEYAEATPIDMVGNLKQWAEVGRAAIARATAQADRALLENKS